MSIGELLVCALVALIVLGPERLPVATRVLGRWLARLSRLSATIRQDIEQAQAELSTSTKTPEAKTKPSPCTSDEHLL